MRPLASVDLDLSRHRAPRASADASALARPDDVTDVLAHLHDGDTSTPARLLPLVYSHMRAIAGRVVGSIAPDPMIQATDLLHHAFFRLMQQERVDWQDRNHFYAVAARIMRRLVLDWAEHERTARSGAGARVPLDDHDAPSAAPGPLTVLTLDECLSRLATLDRDAARVVDLRCFGGLTCDEIAGVLDLSPRTVERRWRVARAWLRAELGDEAPS